MFGPDGFSPNGLLPNEVASVTQALEPERWATAEERTAELIACIQPNKPSEERRNAVLCYVQRLIMNCFPCQVFTFGSVPLKTYLPDGDIDLTVFTENLNLKETWANEVRDILEHEEKNENAEFHVKEVQYIQAEVKIIKCLVENIVVDISFDQLGGLCTLCFLEELLLMSALTFKVDQLIDQNHLFKRSIILIKAWCYYESRILGAHHGLISTYALETLVLYIFHVFNNKFAGPLEVLYRFLDFFSKFDWENFCISLWGPVPISSLPDMTALSPRKDGGQILLSKFFLDVCSSVVSKGNFFRIRSAFAFGAQRLDRLLDCPKENLLAEFKQFFLNTWERHGKAKRQKRIPSGHQSKVGVTHAAHASDSVSSLHVNHNLKQTSRPGNISAISGTQGQSMQANLTNSMVSHQNNQNLRCNSLNENPHNEKMTSSGTHYLGNDVNPRYQFARTQSSPELTDTSSDVSSRGRHNRASETVNGQTASARSHSSRRRNLVPEVLENHGAKFSTEDSLSSRHSLSHQIIDASVDSTSASNNYFGNSGEGTIEQDRVDMASFSSYSVNEQAPINAASFESSWVSNLHYPRGFIQNPESQCFPSMGMTSDQEVTIEKFDAKLAPKELSQEECDHGFWSKPDADFEERGLIRENYSGDAQYQISKESDAYSPTSFRFVPASETSSSGSKSEDNGDGLLLRTYKSMKDRRGKKSVPSTDSSIAYGMDRNERQCEEKSVDHISLQPDDDNREWISLSTIGTELSESMVSGVDASHVWNHQIPVYDPASVNRSNSMLSVAPMFVGPNSHQRTSDNHGALPFAFYPTGPPVPFLALVPLYNVPTEAGTSSHHQCTCRGHFPWDGPGRPSVGMNLLTQHMSGPHLIPVSPVHPGSSRQPGFYQHYADNIPRYRAGTGTYLPNPKISYRDRQFSNSRNHRGNNNYDRKDHHDDREGNWNNNSRPRFGGRSQSQNQVEKPSFRMDRSTPNNHRSDRSWNSKKDPLPPHHPRSGSFSFSNSTNRGSTNVAYGMYPPVQVVNHSEVSAPVVMLYPHDRNLGYSSAGEHLEFGSLGPAHFTGDKASPHLGEDSTRGINEQQDFRRDSDLSSPDQPPSPTGSQEGLIKWLDQHSEND
ncbi:hypothetical protein OIU78_029344 [Salix suchowensis]|nr:hypothetical protein OIU78_029344 [Salix suchowensis]